MAQSSADQAVRAAMTHHKDGRLAEAKAIYQQVLASNPNNVDALHYLGVLAYQQGDAQAGVQLMQQALALNPQLAPCYSNMGEAWASLRRLDMAVSCCQRAIQIDPNFPEAWSNLCNALRSMGRMDEAIVAGRRAVQLRPDFWAAVQNLANALGDVGRTEEAVALYRRGVQIDPKSSQGWANWGATVLGIGDLDQAVALLRKAAQLDEKHSEAWNNLSVAMMDLGQVEEAHRCSLRAIECAPKDAAAHSNLLLGLHYRTGSSPQAVFHEHLNWAKRHAAPLASTIRPHTNNRTPERPLRIGYLSPDFRRHSVAYFLEPALIHHDRGQFQICCYAHVRRPDDYTQRLRGYAGVWRDVMGLGDQQLADLIRQDGIDILVDLAGHSADNRLPVLGRKPAPVQVSWLGYPATTGMSTVDWRLTDALADPPGTTDAFYSEKLYRLPEAAWCYRPSPEAPAVGPVPSLSSGRITFGSFNNFAKVSPEVLAAWARILAAVPGSRLILKSRALGSRIACDHVRQTFTKLGIDPGRVDLFAKVPSLVNHLAMYGRVDIALDTFPYNGTTTTCEALWMGVSVVALVGQMHVARAGVSLLSCAGLTELLASSVDQYVQLAVELAGDSQRRRSLRFGLRDRLSRCAVTDGPGFTRRLEAAYRDVWRQWAAAPAP